METLLGLLTFVECTEAIVLLQDRRRECGQGGGQGGRVEREAEGRRGRAGEARHVIATGLAKLTNDQGM